MVKAREITPCVQRAKVESLDSGPCACACRRQAAFHKCVLHVAHAAGDKAKALQASIDELAKKYGGTKVNAHLTLMGGIVDDQAGAEDRAKLLASQLKVRSHCSGRFISALAGSQFSIYPHGHESRPEGGCLVLWSVEREAQVSKKLCRQLFFLVNSALLRPRVGSRRADVHA